MRVVSPKRAQTATATVLYAHELSLVPITTPAYSPQSNGLAEAFVKTFKRDYLDGAALRDAIRVRMFVPASGRGDATEARTSRSWQSIAKATERTSPLQQGIKKTSEHQRWFDAGCWIWPRCGRPCRRCA